jgi:3-mercaptopyruvate sulfurtransferase SseA
VLELKQKGIERGAALLGGWNAWLAQHLPTETSEQEE